MKFLFIGNLLDYDKKRIVSGRSIPQNQSLNFQMNFIDGLIDNVGANNVEVVALPLFGSFLISKSSFYYNYSKYKYRNSFFYIPFFLNIPIIKWLFWVSFIIRKIKITQQGSYGEALNLILYSSENGFLFYPLIFQRKKNFTISIIITDLPYKLNCKLNKKDFHGLYFGIQKKLFSTFNKYILITEQINELIEKPIKDYVVIDGFILNKKQNSLDNDRPINTIIYAGTLDPKYGINDIITLSNMFDKGKIDFLIFGHTESKELLTMFNNSSTIKFMGFKNILELHEYYCLADGFIIPRPSNIDNNSYSNPSKIYEYLSFDKPVIINDLPSLPSDLRQVLIINDNKDDTVLGFFNILQDLIEGNSNQLDSRFEIYRLRNPKMQLRKYLDIL